MTQDERNQLTEISRPESKGRLSSHELLAKIVLEQQDKIRELEQSLVLLLKQETSAINLMTQLTERIETFISTKKRD
jgi:hypothetical protein